MKKNVLIVVLALIVVGGAGYIIGDKAGEKKQVPETTIQTPAAETAGNVNYAPETTEMVVVEPPATTEKVVEVVESIVYVPESKVEPATEQAKPVEKVTEPVKPVKPEAPVTEAATKANKNPEQVKNTSEAIKKISADEAKKIALNHAGFKAADVRGLEVELDSERGALEYEVSFENGKYDYDYDIDAVTGKIKFSEKSIDD